MKINDVHISKSALGDTIYVCTISKKNPKLALQKVDRTNEFWRAVIDMCGGYEQEIQNQKGEKFKIICEKVKRWRLRK